MCQKQAGAGLGAIAAAAAAGPSVWSVLGGAVGGSVVGIIAHMASPVARAAELPSGSAQSEACQQQRMTLVHCVAVAELGGSMASFWLYNAGLQRVETVPGRYFSRTALW